MACEQESPGKEGSGTPKGPLGTALHCEALSVRSDRTSSMAPKAAGHALSHPYHCWRGEATARHLVSEASTLVPLGAAG